VNCEQAQVLLSARLDGAVAPEDRARLEVHLEECAICRAVDAGNRLLDADLRRAFARRRQAAARVAERTAALLPALPPRRMRRRLPWLTMLASAAAGFLVALAIYRPPWHRESTEPPPTARPVVHLVLATGPVEVQAPGQASWQEVAAGEPVAIGCRLRTSAKTRCELRTAEGSELQLDSDTEIALDQERRLHLSRGQLLALVARAAVPFEVQAPDATVTAVGTQFNVLCEPAEVVVTVLEGATRVQTPKNAEEVKAGERARIVEGRIADKQEVARLARATSWANELRVRKARDSKELARRVDDILAQIGHTKAEFMDEEEIRALGDHCVLPLTRFIQSKRSRQPGEHAARITAAKILADLAQPWSIPDLIGMLDDPDPDVRFYAARGLQRLTGETQGVEPEKWRKQSRDELTAARQKWQAWLQAKPYCCPSMP
jgi:ferric-dicitrate binding protein FerR (iron transport regulator)